MNYKEDLLIDPSALDVEWLAQANKMMEYVKLQAEAKRTVDRLKEKLDAVEARISKLIRKSPSKYGMDKPTEPGIKAAIKLHRKCIAATEALIDAKYDSDLLTGAVRAFEHRKRALENLVTLNGQSYFAAPSEPRNLEREWDKRVKQGSARSSVRSSLKKKSRRTKT